MISGGLLLLSCFVSGGGRGVSEEVCCCYRVLSQAEDVVI